MARPPRHEIVDGTFHLATRAVDSASAFRCPDDRHVFLSVLAQVVGTYHWLLHSFCLMGTHYHLIVRTPRPTLSAGMQALNGTYGRRFNERHGRRGHLFGARFSSVRVETEAHLLAAHRYVAMNPVNAGLCERPEDWSWSSFRALAGLAPPPWYLDRSVLSLFHVRDHAAAAAFARFVRGTAGGDVAFEDLLARKVGV
jgi:putative transposase